MCCSLACLDTCPQRHNERNLGLVWFQVLTSLGFLGYLTCSSLSDLYSLTLDGMIECLSLTIVASVCWVPISIAVGSQLTMSHVSVTKTCFCYNQPPEFSRRKMFHCFQTQFHRRQVCLRDSISLHLSAKPSVLFTDMQCEPKVSLPHVLPRSVIPSLGARQPPGSKRESGTGSSDTRSRGYLLRL